MFRLASIITIAMALRGVPCAAQTAPKAETDADRVQAALERGDPAGALVWYERIGSRAPQRRDLLARIVALRARQLTSDSDRRVVVEACRAQVAAGSKACLTDARRIADDYGAEMGTRLAATTLLVEAGTPGSQAMFQTLVGIAAGNEPAAAAGALAGHLVSSSVHPLMLLAGNANADAKYIATLALVRLRSKETLPVLRTIAADRESGAARLIAHIGLAASGDKDSMTVLDDTLPLMQGRDLLEAGRALVALKDPRGAPILRSIAEGNDELLRIEAAEALHQAQPSHAARLIQSGCESSNPWVRARALEVAATLRIEPTLSMRRAMLDSNSWVAVRAVQAVTADRSKPSR